MDDNGPNPTPGPTPRQRLAAVARGLATAHALIERLLAEVDALRSALPAETASPPPAERPADEGPAGVRVEAVAAELGPRARHGLHRAGAVTLGDVARMTEWDLLGLKNFGKGALGEVKAVLAARDLSLRGERPAASPVADEAA